MILLRIIIGVRLVIVARRNNLPNLYWLAAMFFTVAIGVLFAPTEGNPLGDLPISLWMFIGMANAITMFLIIPFNQATFYRDRKSPQWWYVGLCTILAILTVYGLIRSESNYNQNPWAALASLGIMITVIWHGWAAYRALAAVAKERAVEDWIKARYRLIVLYSALVVILTAAGMVRTVFAGGATETPLGNAMALLELIVNITLVSVQFLAWVMPEGYRRWLNRNYQSPVQDEAELTLSEEEIMRRLKA